MVRRPSSSTLVPYTTLFRSVVEVAPGRGVVRLPDRDELRNHVGSQHAGALFSAGEAASGAAFVGAFAERLGELTPPAQGIGRAHGWTPVTPISRMPSSACKN